ncbi:MAG TPA: ribulose-phosphate 3-epimerase [Muribaculaceae bacterium]|jgi:ribulose-phosphate 3-epimerase|nr:ribulose-phosphate 3-epimerase [Muribaculaceae bacterium]
MQISPSILSADFGHLEQEINMVNESRATMVHLDVMDGVFVPNISFGFPVIKTVAKYSTKPLDVHLMIVNPQNYISQVRDSGAAIMNIHQEACTHLHRTVQAIKAAGMKAAVTLNPSTPVLMLEDIITDLDMALIMSVNPGFGGQAFIPNAVNKVRQLRELITRSGSKALIQVDGGVNLSTGKLLAEAGADVLVAGNSVFNSGNPINAISELSDL